MAKEPKSKEPDFLNSLDVAAIELLAQAGLSGNIGPDQSGDIMADPSPGDGDDTANLAEKVRAFQAVMTYAQQRPQLAPQKPKESGFASLQRKFNAAPERRGNRAKGEGADVPAGGGEPDADSDD